MTVESELRYLLGVALERIWVRRGILGGPHDGAGASMSYTGVCPKCRGAARLNVYAVNGERQRMCSHCAAEMRARGVRVQRHYSDSNLEKRR